MERRTFSPHTAVILLIMQTEFECRNQTMSAVVEKQTDKQTKRQRDRPGRCCSRACVSPLAVAWRCRHGRGVARTTQHTSSEQRQPSSPSPPLSQPSHSHTTAPNNSAYYPQRDGNKIQGRQLHYRDSVSRHRNHRGRNGEGFHPPRQLLGSGGASQASPMRPAQSRAANAFR